MCTDVTPEIRMRQTRGYNAAPLRKMQRRQCSMPDITKSQWEQEGCTNAGSRPFRTKIAVIFATLDMSVKIVPTEINDNS